MHVTMAVGKMIATLSDLVGIKSGLALDDRELVARLDSAATRFLEAEDSQRWWRADPTSMIRFEATEIQESFLLVMQEIGSISDLSDPSRSFGAG